MKKIVFSIGILLFLGLMLFNVNSSQHLSNSGETIAVLKMEEMNVMANWPVECYVNFDTCPTGPCQDEVWCPGCYDAPMYFAYGEQTCDP